MTRQIALSAVEVFCDSRVPPELRDEIRLESALRGNSITILEHRPPLEAGADGQRVIEYEDGATALRRIGWAVVP